MAAKNAVAAADCNNKADREQLESPQGQQRVLYDVEHLATFSRHNSTQAAEAKGANLNGSHKSSPIKSNGSLESANGVQDPRVALERLFDLEKLSGIWTQRMQIELHDNSMLIVDSETNSVVERFQRDQVIKPEAFNEHNDIYNNIIVFSIEQTAEQNTAEKSQLESAKEKEQSGELHIFQCVSHGAQELVSHILKWKSKSCDVDKCDLKQVVQVDGIGKKREKCLDEDKEKSSSSHLSLSSSSDKREFGKEDRDKNRKEYQNHNGASSQVEPAKQEPNDKMNSPTTSAATNNHNKPPVVVTAAASKSPNANGDIVPIVNVNVKETVQVFNQIAALREKGNPTSPTNHARPLSDSSIGSASGSGATDSQPASESQQTVATRLSEGGQLYKQRSIRATLAPLTRSRTPDQERPQQQQQQRAPPNGNCGPNTAPTTANGNSSVSCNSSASSSASTSSCSPKANGQSKQPGGAPTKVASSAQHLESALLGNSRQQKQKSRQNEPLASDDQQQLAPEESSRARSKERRLHNGNNNAAKNHHNNQAGKVSAASRVQAPLPAPPSPQARDVSAERDQQRQQQLDDQVATNESYVSVLNHCFDDIEKFIIRLQQAFAATRELQQQHNGSQQKHNNRRSAHSKNHSSRSSMLASNSTNGTSQMLANSVSSSSSSSTNSAHNNQPAGAYNKLQQQPLPPIPRPHSAETLAALYEQSRGPNGDDYFEILSKFKLAFNLLAKLKGCIHEPNAPELVHFLFTPLAIIIESARNVSPPIDPTLVGIPYLNRDALELLSNCCTSKESDLWLSLGSNWTQTIDVSLLRASRLPTSFQPIFSDGWAPVINELELIGLPSPSSLAAAGGSSPSPPQEPFSATDREHQLYQQQQLHSRRATRMEQQHYRECAEDRRSHSAARVCSTDALLDQHQPVRGKRTSAIAASLGDGLAEPILDYNELAARSSSRGRVRGYASPGQQQQAAMLRRAPLAKPERHYQASRHYHSQGPPPLDPLDIGEPVHPFAASYSDDYVDLPTADQLHMKPAPLLTASAANKREQLMLMRHYRSSEHIVPSSVAAAHHQQQRAVPLGQRYLAADRQPQLNTMGHNGPRRKARGVAKYADAEEHYLDAAAYFQVPPYQLTRDQLAVEQDRLEAEEREAMLLDLGPTQTEWFLELQARGALVVRVLFSRDANNDKELSVRRGELLEVLDDSRKWWKARSVDMEVGHVPHTIVAPMHRHQTLDQLLANTSHSELLLNAAESTSSSSGGATSASRNPTRAPLSNGRFVASRRGEMVGAVPGELLLVNGAGGVDDRRGPKAAGAFRYF